MKNTITIIILAFISHAASIQTQAQPYADSCFFTAHAINWKHYGETSYLVYVDSVCIVSDTGPGVEVHPTFDGDELYKMYWTYHNASSELSVWSDSISITGIFTPDPGVDSVHYSVRLGTIPSSGGIDGPSACIKILEGYMLFHPDGSVDTARTNEAYRDAMRAAGIIPPDGSTSAAEMDLKHSITLYPNPTTDILTIDVEKYGYISADLLDYTGRLISTTSHRILDLTNKASGIYYVRVRTTQGNSMHKIIRH